jgi:hypothetical protein
MNTQTYLVGVLSFVFMITNLLGAAFTISRLRSKTTQVTDVTPVDRAPTGASHGARFPNQKSNLTAAIFVRLGAVHLTAEGMAFVIGLGGLVLASFALLKIL